MIKSRRLIISKGEKFRKFPDPGYIKNFGGGKVEKKLKKRVEHG